MRPLVVAWLARHGLPPWLAPDYVLMVGLAAIVGAILVLRLARRDGEDVAVQARALLLAYGAALVGGFAFEWARAVPVAIALRSLGPILYAGRAAYGGLLAALLVPAIYLRRRPGAVLAFFDRAVVPMGISFAFVRVGCLLEGCDYGRPTALPWGLRFPPGSLAARAHAMAGWVPDGGFSLPVHPTELYESLLGIVALGVALPVLLRRSERDGRAFAVWMTVYAVGRFGLELLRADADRGIYAGLSSAQWVSILVLAVLGIANARRRLRPRLTAAASAFVVLLVSAGIASATPTPPPSAPTPAPAQADALVLKDGTRVVGKITDLVAGDHATVVFPDGHTSTYPWSTVARIEVAGVQMTYETPAPPTVATPTPPLAPAAPALSLQHDRLLAFRLTLVSSVVLARPDVPSGFATEVAALYRLRIDDHRRLDLGLEGRELQNVEATEWSLGVVADLVFEVGRRFELLLEGAIFNTWFNWAGSSSSYFENTNAYGMRLAVGAQLALGSHVLLGVSPLAFSTLSSQTVGVITGWEPRVWLGLDL